MRIYFEKMYFLGRKINIFVGIRELFSPKILCVPISKVVLWGKNLNRLRFFSGKQNSRNQVRRNDPLMQAFKYIQLCGTLRTIEHEVLQFFCEEIRHFFEISSRISMLL